MNWEIEIIKARIEKAHRRIDRLVRITEERERIVRLERRIKAILKP